jgi:hypothetical protein
MRHWNHYEVAFETFLRERRIPFLAVEERRRPQLEDGSTLKNLDFVVSPSGRPSLLIDVKGRRFPGAGGYWKHWSTRDDLSALRHWETLFGDKFSALFVFAYLICGDRSPVPMEQLFRFRKRLYAFIAMPLSTYLSEIHLLSPRWQTFAMPTQRFRELAKPFEYFVVND